MVWVGVGEVLSRAKTPAMAVAAKATAVASWSGVGVTAGELVGEGVGVAGGGFEQPTATTTNTKSGGSKTLSDIVTHPHNWSC